MVVLHCSLTTKERTTKATARYLECLQLPLSLALPAQRSLRPIVTLRCKTASTHFGSFTRCCAIWMSIFAVFAGSGNLLHRQFQRSRCSSDWQLMTLTPATNQSSSACG